MRPVQKIGEAEPTKDTHGGPDSERHSEDDRDDQRGQGQLHRRRKELLQVLQDGTAGGEGLAEIAVQDVCEVGEELLWQRLVEPPALDEGGTDRRILGGLL
jgi:hypothetical protein